MPLTRRQVDAIESSIFLLAAGIAAYASHSAIASDNEAQLLQNEVDQIISNNYGGCEQHYNSISDCPFFFTFLSKACEELCKKLSDLSSAESAMWISTCGAAATGTTALCYGYKLLARCFSEQPQVPGLQQPLLPVQIQVQDADAGVDMDEPALDLTHEETLQIAEIDSDRYHDNFLEQGFLCPISLEIMNDPVVAWDGKTYERAAISKWIASGKTNSPLGFNNKEECPFHKFLRSDVVMRNRIKQAVNDLVATSHPEESKQNDTQQDPSALKISIH